MNYAKWMRGRRRRGKEAERLAAARALDLALAQHTVAVQQLRVARDASAGMAQTKRLIF